jgi:hypothetical protein
MAAHRLPPASIVWIVAIGELTVPRVETRGQIGARLAILPTLLDRSWWPPPHCRPSARHLADGSIRPSSRSDLCYSSMASPISSFAAWAGSYATQIPGTATFWEQVWGSNRRRSIGEEFRFELRLRECSPEVIGRRPDRIVEVSRANGLGSL